MSLVFAVICSELLLPWPLDGGYSLVTKKKDCLQRTFLHTHIGHQLIQEHFLELKYTLYKPIYAGFYFPKLVRYL